MKRISSVLLSLALIETSIGPALAAGARISLNQAPIGTGNSAAAAGAAGSSSLSLAAPSAQLALPTISANVPGVSGFVPAQIGGVAASAGQVSLNGQVSAAGGHAAASGGDKISSVDQTAGGVKVQAAASASSRIAPEVKAGRGLSGSAAQGNAAAGAVSQASAKSDGKVIVAATAKALGIDPAARAKGLIEAPKLNLLYDGRAQTNDGGKDADGVEGGSFEGATPAEKGLKKAEAGAPDMDAFTRGLRTQGLLLRVAAKSSGMHVTILSMVLNAHIDAGLSLKDWMDIADELAATQADEAEIAAAFARDLKNTRWAKPIGEGDKLSEDDIMDLSMRLRGAATSVTIARNGRFFDWMRALERGDARAAATDFAKAGFRRSGDDIEITFGATVDGVLIRPRLDGRMSTQESTAKHVAMILEAARKAGADVSGLLRLADALEADGLVPKGWSEKTKKPGSKLYGGAALGLAGLSLGSVWLAVGLAALGLLIHMAWIVLSKPAPDADTVRNYQDKLERAAGLRQLADPTAGTPSLAASGSMNPERARALSAELYAEARETANQYPDLAWPIFAGIVRSLASPFKWFFKEPEPGLGDPHWVAVAPAVRDEIAAVRKMGSKAERREYLRKIGAEILEKIKKARGTEEIGFHYNLHGGRAEEYLNGGIHATRGDISLQYTTNPTASMLANKVYFFRDSVNLFDILNESHPQMFFIPSRMGYVLMLFRLDSDYLKKAFAEGGASNPSAISIDFNENWLAGQHKGRMIGIPASTFLSDPMSVFHRVKARIGHKGRLSRDEETLATMRYIEAVMTAPENLGR